MPSWLDSFLRMQEHQLSSTVHLALTRGLFPREGAPVRDQTLFDTFAWVRQAYEIPSGCLVFTDGSLLDNKLPRECHALGWAFAVVTVSGELIASANGVPPRWVNTIQGAELWAVLKALQSVTFPSGLYTDCDTVRSGVARGVLWGGSSKRKYSRVWTSLSTMLDENTESVHWMPAHTPKSSIGCVHCSDGSIVDDIKWCSNQIVDLLAKDAAEGNRVSPAFRASFLFRESQLRELVVYLGRLTHAANSFQGPEGVIRDSDPKGRKKRGDCKANGRSGSMANSSGAPAKRAVTKWSMPRRSSSVMRVSSLVRCSSRSKAKNATAALAASSEASFMELWHENRAASMKPAGGPSATERLNALKQRVAARTAAPIT